MPRGLLLLPALALPACAASVAVPALTGVLDVDPALTLGPTALDESSLGVITARNLGDAALTVTGTQDGSTAFTLLDPGPWTLPAQGSATIQLRFTPVDGALQSGTLTLSPDPTQAFAVHAAPVQVSLSGEPDPDADDDGALHPLAGGADCDDRDPAINPDSEEIWYDGADQDCDGQDDDQDGDGAGVLDDCDDQDPAVSPGASELEPDGRDSDCDGLVDEDAVEALVGAVFVNELLVASTWTDADYGLYVELLNGSAETLSLAGWRLGDGGSAGQISEDLSLDPGGVAVLCAEGDETLNHGLPCDAVVAPWPDPDTGELALLAPIYTDRGVESQRITIDALRWDGAWPMTAGASTQLDPAWATGALNDDPASWCLSYSGSTGTDLGTPGAANLSCP